MNLSVCHLSFSDLFGGAARAAFRLHCACNENSVHSRMEVSKRLSDFDTIYGPRNKFEKYNNLLRAKLGTQLMRLQVCSIPGIHSPAFLPSTLAKKLNSAECDILNLHWICNEFLAVEDIGKLKKPLVWTLHDMWPFAGAEHYCDDSDIARWRVGYRADNRPADHTGIDIDRWVWNRKHRAWKTPMHIVAPTRWLGNCARQSALMHDWPIHVIPNLLDTEVFQQWPKLLARKIFGLPEDTYLVLFGAIGGTQDPRKGWDLLEPALAQLSTLALNIAGVILGQSEPYQPPRLGFPLHWMGHLQDDVSLALLYSAVDVVVVPSRQDNLPQVGTEAQACGCPVVGFNTCGLPSVLVHQETGYLAHAFDVQDLTKGIAWVLADADLHTRLSHKARDRAVRLWSPEVVISQYLAVYKEAILDHSQHSMLLVD